jgi:hypothetical protein
MKVGTKVNVTSNYHREVNDVQPEEVFEITSWGQDFYAGDPEKGEFGLGFVGGEFGCTVWNKEHGMLWVGQFNVKVAE